MTPSTSPATRSSTEAGRKAVVVLTDAEDNGSKVRVEEAIEAAQRTDTVVHILRLTTRTTAPTPASPLFQERLDYLQHCAAEGYASTTLRPLATDLLLIQNLLGLPESSHKLEPSTVRAAIDKWATREPKYFSHKNGRRCRENLPQRES